MKQILVDTTLRDGEQAPGVVFSLKEKIKIACMLDELGIEEIESGTPAIGNDEVQVMKILNSLGLSAKTTAWCRATKSDIDAARKTRCNNISISFPVSDVQLQTLDKDRHWVYNTLNELVQYSSDYFERVFIGAQDASRAELPVLQNLFSLIDASTASRVRIADTVGILSPIQTYDLIYGLKKSTSDIEIEFHGHNDFGMATANAIAAIQAGANAISATVNGLGERAGNSALEEIIMARRYVLGQHNRYKADLLKPLSDFVAYASCKELPDTKPITGKMALRHESGIHTNSIIKNKSSYQIIENEELGISDAGFVFGRMTGKSAVRHLLESHNLPASDKQVNDILHYIKTTAQKEKREVLAEEIIKKCSVIGV